MTPLRILSVWFANNRHMLLGMLNLQSGHLIFAALSDGDRSLPPRDRRGIWVEFKIKSRSTVNRSTFKRETGINARLWDHYLWVSETTASPVVLCFCQQAEDEIRAVVVSAKTRHRRYGGTGMGPGGMVFFEMDGLVMLSHLSDVLEARRDAQTAPLFGNIESK